MARARASQKQVATGLGMSQAALSRRLLGAVPFTPEQLILIARQLGVSATEFGVTELGNLPERPSTSPSMGGAL